jgi:hypothetical protein
MTYLRPFSATLLATILLSLPVRSQDKPPEKSLKIYSNFAWDQSGNTEQIYAPGLEYSIYPGGTYDLGYFSPAYRIENEKGNAHELEISRFSIREEVVEIYDRRGITAKQRYSENRIELALRYEFILGANLFNSDSRFSTAMGFSASPQFTYRVLDPDVTTAFNLSQTELGLIISIVPRIEYALSENFYLDLNMPLTVADYQFYATTDQSATLPLDQRKTHTTEFVTFPANFLVRFGLGLQI